MHLNTSFVPVQSVSIASLVLSTVEVIHKILWMHLFLIIHYLLELIITLIPKKGLCQSPADYRPIGLRNIPYKIEAKIFSK